MQDRKERGTTDVRFVYFEATKGHLPNFSPPLRGGDRGEGEEYFPLTPALSHGGEKEIDDGIYFRPQMNHY